MTLATHFAEKYGRENGREIKRISPEATALLTAYPWPGNIRELENVLERAALLCDPSGIIEAVHLPPAVQGSDGHGGAGRAGTDAVQTAGGNGGGSGKSPFLNAAPSVSPVTDAHETFSESVEDLMSTSIANAVAPFNLPPDRLSPAEREEVVISLHKRGFFQLRGAVEHVAEAFALSEATIYRYLKSVQKREGR